MSEGQKILGITMPIVVAGRKIDIYPVRLKDWGEFGKHVRVIELESLQEIYFYSDAPTSLDHVLRIVTRTPPEEETPSMFGDMTQLEYKKLREIVMEQNELDFSYLDKIQENKSKKAEPLV